MIEEKHAKISNAIHYSRLAQSSFHSATAAAPSSSAHTAHTAHTDSSGASASLQSTGRGRPLLLSRLLLNGINLLLGVHDCAEGDRVHLCTRNLVAGLSPGGTRVNLSHQLVARSSSGQALAPEGVNQREGQRDGD